MISSTLFYGGVRELNTAVDFSLIPWTGRLQIITVTAASKAGTLVDARELKMGSVLRVENKGSNSFAIKNNAGTTIVAAVAAGKMAMLFLRSNSNAAGVWGYKIKNVLS